MLFDHHKKIRCIAQSEVYTCWEACGRMLFLWKNGEKELPRYEKAIAPYKALGRGLYPAELGVLYCTLLGMKAKPKARFAIEKSPVIWRRTHPIGHAMILIALDTNSSRYVNWDPYVSARKVSFDESGGSSASGIIGLAEIISEKTLDRDVVGSVWCYE
ncbi:MAG: papain-like cysteine protease family protein [Isosphaeraceae bacterium]